MDLPVIEFPLTYEETLASIEEKGCEIQKSFAEYVSAIDVDKPIDISFLIQCLKKASCPFYVLCGSDLSTFVAIQLLHLKLGTEFMKRLFTDPNVKLYEFCRSPSYSIDIIEYLTKMGLEDNIYLDDFNGPLRYICTVACTNSLYMKQLMDISKHIITKGFTQQNKDGNTMLHLSPQYPRSTNQYVSFYHIFEYLSTIDGYENALLITNNEGNTPLQHIISRCNCVKTIELLIATPSGKLAAANLNKKGETSFDLFVRTRIHYEMFDPALDKRERITLIMKELAKISKQEDHPLLAAWLS